jgi:hypothetical protein
MTMEELEYYILVNRQPKLVDFMTWARWFRIPENRIVKQTTTDGIFISTVFIGITEGELFETMIFGGKYDKDQWRYSNYDDALAGHQKAIELATHPNKL